MSLKIFRSRGFLRSFLIFLVIITLISYLAYRVL